MVYVKVTVKETPLTTQNRNIGRKDYKAVTSEYKDKGGNVIATKKLKYQ